MSTPIIRQVETLLVDLPTIRAHQLAMTTMHVQTLVIVRLHCDDGIEGIGEATTIGGLTYGEESPEGIKLAIDTYLAPALIGQSAQNINAALDRMEKVARGNTFAKCALENALWDAQAKRLNMPLHQLLGGAVRDRLEVLWTLASGDTAKDIDEAERMLAERRHHTFKLKIGRRAVQQDVAHVAAIKQALGSRARVTVDVNQAWSEAQAHVGVAALQDAGIDLIEQPLARANKIGLQRLSERFNVPIMADEAVRGPDDAAELLRLGAARVFALKTMKTGGLVNLLRTAAVADAGGVALYAGTMLEGSIATMAAAHAFATLPRLEWGSELFGPMLLKDDIVVERPVYEEFSMGLPNTPGIGVQIDEDKLKFYQRKS